MAANILKDEQRLVARLISGDRGAVASFLDLAQTPIWSAIVVLVGDNAQGVEANLAFMEALSAHRFARLARFNGASSLASFLTLDVRDWLAEQTVRQFSDDSNRGWQRFERQYAGDIRRLVKKRFPRADDAQLDDLAQDVRMKLIEDDYRRIRAYKGDHAFTGYILTVVDNLLRDLMRREAPRLRFPAKVMRMTPLQQAVYAAGVWRGVALDPRSMLSALMGKLKPDPTLEEIKAALNELASDIINGRDARMRTGSVSIDDHEGAGGLDVADGLTPEQTLLDAEEAQARDALMQAVRREAGALTAPERAFLDIILSSGEPMPARRIATLMSISAEEVYRLRQRVQRWMSRLAVDLQKTAGASV